MPLVVLVFDLLGARQETEAAADTLAGDVLVVTPGTHQLRGGGSEGLLEQAGPTGPALEAVLVPVKIFVADVTALQAYHLAAALALAGEVALVAGDAGWPEVCQHVLLARELGVTVPAGEVVRVPVSVHGPGVRPGKDELVTGGTPRLHLLRVVPGLGVSGGVRRDGVTFHSRDGLGIHSRSGQLKHETVSDLDIITEW